MRGDQSCAAALRVCREQAIDEFDAFAVEIRVGLVEQPQRCRYEQQARERDALLLSGRKQAHGLVFVAGEADAGERERRRDARTDTAEADREAQILQGGQFHFYAGQMAEQGDLMRELGQGQVHAVEQHLARCGFEQSGQHFEQRSFSAAVVAFNQHDFPRRKRKVERAENRLFVARIGEAVCGQQRRRVDKIDGGHVRRRVARPVMLAAERVRCQLKCDFRSEALQLDYASGSFGVKFA